jgi:hypothetical protein
VKESVRGIQRDAARRFVRQGFKRVGNIFRKECVFERHLSQIEQIASTQRVSEEWGEVRQGRVN